MDDLFDALVDPIEKDNITKPTPEKFPDMYRPYLFNDPYLELTKSAQENAELTKTKLKYWEMDIDDLIDKLIRMVSNYYKYFKLQKQKPFTYHLTNKDTLKPVTTIYYNKIYAIADIIISPLRQKNISSAIKKLFDVQCCPNHMLQRITIYFIVYFIKITQNQYPKFVLTAINKLHEYEKEQTINNYFTKEELANYILYTEKIYGNVL